MRKGQVGLITTLSLAALLLGGTVLLRQTAVSAATKAEGVVQRPPKSAKGLPTALPLEIQPLVYHGHIVEIKGRTEPEATVLINGERVPLVLGDGSFTFFAYVPARNFRITITAQNRNGATKTLQQDTEE